MTQVREMLQCLSSIYSTSGRKDKEALLEKQKNNPYLKELLIKSMSTSVVIGISEKTFQKIIDKSEMYYKPEQEKALWKVDNTITHENFKACINLIDELNSQSKPTPNNNVIDKLTQIFLTLCPIERYWYYRMFIGNLSIGIGPKAVNKIFGPIIEQYTPMLADSGIEKLSKWTFNSDEVISYYTDTKIDGLRLTTFFYPDNVIVKTRSGKRFWPLEIYFKEHLLNHDYIQNFINVISNEFNEKCNDNTLGFAIDSEILDLDGTWESSVSLVNVDNLQVTKLDEFNNSIPAFHLLCFDLVNLNPFKPENFNKQVTTLPYYRRRELLEYFVNMMPNIMPFKFFKLTKVTECITLENVQTKAQEYINNGYEGAVVKHPYHQYICDRKNVWLKIKDIQTFDGIITDVLPGESSGKYNSMASKLLVKVNIDGKDIIGTIGTGFKDEDRKYLWDNKNSVIGKVVEFTLLSKTVNDNFRSGVYKGLRIDKVDNNNAN